MNQRISALVLSAMLLALSLPAEAQQPKTVVRIGYLASLDPVSDPRFEGIRQSLREFGYREGQNITIEYRNTEGKLDRYAEFAAEVVRLKVDVIVVSGGNLQIRTVMNTTKTIPIVMAGQGSAPCAPSLCCRPSPAGGQTPRASHP